MKTVLSLILLGMLHMSAFAQCTGSVGDPIVDNTFGAGAANPGPALSPGTTNMIYVSTTCPQDGQYTIANYTSGCFGGWITLTDHTGNTNGYYMLVNADPTPKTFFNDTIDNLCGGVDYLFSAWVINVVARTGYIEPNLTFSIRTPSGTLLQSNNTGNIPISGTTWGLHSFNFTTPAGVTSVVLSISNNATGGSGNDLAIDDISFRAVGPLTSVGIQGYTVDTVSFCGSIPALTLTSQVQPCYASTDYQWQRSANGGTTWADITGATNPTYLPGISTYGTYLYRLAVAAHGNIGSARCQVVSTVISITYAPGPALTVSPKDTSVCPGKKVIITASGPTGTYIWSDGHHGPIDTVTVNAASLYIVTVTSSSGCTSVDTAFTHIGTLATPSITTTGTAHCPTDSLTLTATGGTSYIWSTGALTPAIRVYPLPVRTYTVTASNASGCTASASVTPPGGTPWSFTIQVVNPPCPGRNMGTITVSVGGGGTYHYAWSNGDTQAQTDSLAPGPYTVTVSDGGNCDTVLSFNLVSGTFLSINTTDTTICPGKQVRLTASGGTGQYQWVNGPATATNTVTATTDSIFIVHMTGATGGCPSADTAHIHIQPSTQPIITQQAPQRCAGDPITLIVSGGSGYTWSTTATTSSISIVPVTGTIYYVTATAPNLCPAVASFTVQGKSRMVVTSTAFNPPCPGRDMGTISISVSGATTPYHYLWSNGDTLSQTDSLSSGPYAVTVTDAGGCDTVLNFALTYGTFLSINTPDTTICPGKQVRLTASGGTGQYQWVNGPAAATNTVTATRDTMFIVHMTGATGGCPSADTAHIHIQPSTQPVITQQAPQRCAGDPITLIATGGAGYTWSTTATTSSISIVPVTGTIYYVTATAPNLCPAVASFTVQSKSPMVVTSTVSGPPCPGRDMGIISISVSGGSIPYHYLWSNSDTLSQTDSLSPGPYTVTVTDAGGCDSVLNFTLTYGTFLSINTSDTTICPGKQVRLTASGGTGQYQWVNGPAAATNTVTATTDSMFIVHMTGATGGCPAADTAHIHIQPSTQPVITQQAPQRCAGDPITLIASGGTGYTWSTIATTSSISIVPVTGAIYYVTATAPNLCPAVDTFIAQAKLPMIITPGQSDPPCPGRDVGTIDLFSGGNSYHYIWSNNDTTAHLNGLAPGVYTVTVSDGTGCDTVLHFDLSYSYTLQVAISPQDTTVPSGVYVPLQASTNVDNGNIYTWTPPRDLSCYDCPGPLVHAVDSTYTYTILVTDQYGCTALDSMHITTFPLGPIYIPNAFTPNGDNNNDFFQIFGPSVSREYIPEFEVKIFDRWGELIFVSSDPTFRWDGIYKGVLMPPGVYVYLIDYLQAGTAVTKHAKGSLALIR